MFALNILFQNIQLIKTNSWLSCIIVSLLYAVYSTGVGLGNTENVPCDNCNKRQCDYCSNIAVEYLLQ